MSLDLGELTGDAGFGSGLGVLCDALPYESVDHHLSRGPPRWMGEVVDGVEYLLPHLLRDPGSCLSYAGVAQDFAGSAVKVDFVECERCVFSFGAVFFLLESSEFL